MPGAVSILSVNPSASGGTSPTRIRGPAVLPGPAAGSAARPAGPGGAAASDPNMWAKTSLHSRPGTCHDRAVRAAKLFAQITRALAPRRIQQMRGSSSG